MTPKQEVEFESAPLVLLSPIGGDTPTKAWANAWWAITRAEIEGRTA